VAWGVETCTSAYPSKLAGANHARLHSRAAGWVRAWTRIAAHPFAQCRELAARKGPRRDLATRVIRSKDVSGS